MSLNINNVFIIAELSCNHNGNLEIAKKTIKAIKESGADAVKIQTYTADTMTIDSDNDYFKISGGTLWDNMTLYKLYQEAYTPWEWHKELKEYTESLGVMFFSSPFDKTAVDFLEKLDVPMYKIASFEISDIPLIEYTASKNKPMIISTGIATMSEIFEAVNACRKVGNNDITLLKCTSSYPAPYEEANLKTIKNLSETFNVKVGLSDHTLGSAVSIASVALGAKVIEKHFILDKKLGGHDALFSMEPDEFKKMVNDIRIVEKAIGKVSYDLSDKVKKTRVFKRSLFAVRDIKKGEIFTIDNVRSIRPGYGISSKYINKIIDKKSKMDIKKGTPIKWEMF